MASVSVSATQSTSASVFTQTSTATNNGAVSTTLADGSLSLNDQLTASSPATTVGTNLMSHSGFVDTTTNQPVAIAAQQYSGPVSDVQEQFVDVILDNLNISVSTPNWFIHSGNGNDALAVSSGTNVLDGGTGSNFLTGGSGTDTFSSTTAVRQQISGAR